jgi:sporulation protein YlmC with PRC-barrel domain
MASSRDTRVENAADRFGQPCGTHYYADRTDTGEMGASHYYSDRVEADDEAAIQPRSTDMLKFRRTLGASTLQGDKVVNLEGQDIGKIEELMIDVVSGRVAYAVLSFGGLLGMGSKLFALPWSTLTIDETKKRFVANVNKQTLEQMQGFDKEHWPDLGDLDYAQGVYRQWGATPYWT